MYFEIIDKLIAKCLKKLVDWQDNQRIKDIKKCLLMEYSIEDQRRLDRRDARAEGIEIGKRMKFVQKRIGGKKRDERYIGFP